MSEIPESLFFLMWAAAHIALFGLCLVGATLVVLLVFYIIVLAMQCWEAWRGNL